MKNWLRNKLFGQRPVLLAATAACALLGATAGARAEFVVTTQQVGNNLVFTGSGTINTAALTYGFHVTSASAQIGPENPWALFGASGGADYYSGVTNNPTTFGFLNILTFATSATGDMVGTPSSGYLTLPTSYVSDTTLSDTATYDNATLASLGITPGVYTWSWGSGVTADSFVFNATVPEPASLTLLILPALALPGLTRLRRRHPSPPGDRALR